MTRGAPVSQGGAFGASARLPPVYRAAGQWHVAAPRLCPEHAFKLAGVHIGAVPSTWLMLRWRRPRNAHMGNECTVGARECLLLP